MSIAIIGISGRFPEAKNIDEFYKNLCEGKDSIRELSEDRIQRTTIQPDKDYLCMGYLDDIDLFDHDFFNISLGEAQRMDPHQRLILEVAYHTLENSGYSMDFFNGSNTSVYIGQTLLEYFKHVPEYDPMVFTGNLNSITASRISRYFNLRGAAMMIDTACSSSLVSLYNACNDLILKHSDQSLVCGVKLNLFPRLKTSPDAIGLVSSDGKVRSFSADANGSNAGEAVAGVLLKRLDDAIRDKDNIYGIIKGIAVNQDAALSASLTSPNSIAQSEVIIKAWERAGIDPSSIGYIEGHGTATKLGDPIEFEGLNLAFRKFTSEKKFCALSALKSNIGHSDSAAGISGLVKAVLSLKNKKLFPSLHFDKPNPLIDFESSALYVNTKLKDWETQGPRRAGVSSFGLSGTNSHVVLEEYNIEPEETHTNKKETYPFAISAKSKESLKANIEALYTYLISKEEISLKDVCHTLNLGRKHYKFRSFAAATNKEELINALLFERQALNTIPEEFLPDKFIFIFSDEIIFSDSLIYDFCLKYHSFKIDWEKCRSLLDNQPADTNFLTFSFQYCFYRLLGQCGIQGQFLLGDGIGKIVISVIKEKVSLIDGVKAALQFQSETTTTLEERLAALIEKERNNKVLFIEAGPVGNISRGLEERNSNGTYRVVTLSSKETILKKDFSNENENYQQISDDQSNTRTFSEEKEDKLMKFIGALYCFNYPLNWSNNKLVSEGKKIDLPGYQFRKIRCWIKEPLQSKVENWFYDFQWHQTELSGPREEIKDQTFVIIMDQKGIGEALADKLTQNQNRCIRVKPSGQFQKITSLDFHLDFNNEEDFVRLEKDLSQQGIEVNGIFLSGNSEDKMPYTNLSEGLSTHFYVIKAFNKYLNIPGFRLTFVSTASSGNVSMNITPFQSAVQALLKGTLADYPMIIANGICMDINPQEPLESQIQCIIDEVSGQDHIKFVSYSNNIRYIQQIARTVFDVNAVNGLTHVKPNGVYLVTGGAGGIGFEICKSIAQQAAARFIIIGRTDLSAIKDEEMLAREARTEKINNLKTLKNLGSQVDYYAADVACVEEMERAFSEIYEKNNKIDGVIHCAGVGFSEVSTPLKTIEDFNSVLSPKITGTLLLDKSCKPYNPDFFILFSSLNALVPQKNSGDYAAANAFLDAFAHYKQGQGEHCISINWPGWNEVGLAVRKGASKEFDKFKAVKSLTTQDGLLCLHYALGLNKPNIAIANVDLSEFLINPFFAVDISEQTLAYNSEISAGSVKEASANYPVLLPQEENLSSTEQKIWTIWYYVLRNPAIKIDDDFFDLGGHSLIGSQLINRVHKEFGIKLEFETLLDFPTIRTFSAYIDSIANDIDPLYNEIPTIPSQLYYPLSYSQRRLWILSQIEQGLLAYNMPSAFLLNGELNVSALKRSFETLCMRHEILRTNFISLNGIPYQQVNDFSPERYKLGYEDLKNSINAESQASEIVREMSRIHFDLAKDNLIQARLIRIDDAQYLFVLNMHHIISDGWSLQLIIREILELYNAFKEDKPNPLSPLRIQYKDYTAWQNAQLSGDKLKKYHDFWMQQFTGEIPELNITTDHPRPAVKTFNGSCINYKVETSSANKIKELASIHGASIFMVLLASIKAFLYRYSQQTDIIIGTPVSGREHSDLENQVGLYINTLALRTKIAEDETFESLINKVKQNTVEAFKHQVYPLDLLIDNLNLKRDVSRSPLFDVLIVLHNIHLANQNQQQQFQDISVNSHNTDFSISKFDLTFNFMEAEGEIGLNIEYNTDLFSKERIHALLNHFQVFIDDALINLKAPLKQIQYLTSQEKEQILFEFNPPSSPFTKDKTLVELIEAQIEKSPEAIALIADNQSLTYSQLNARANEIAHFLRNEYSLKPDDKIGILMDRSEIMIIGMLAAIKAGAAYVPLDTEYPPERIKYIAEDAGLKLLLTDEPGEAEKYNLPNIPVLGLKRTFDTSPDNPEKINTSADLMYVIYTSGSTGKPKGVEITHSSVVNLLHSIAQIINFKSSDRLFALTTISFDISVQEIFLPLVNGATLVLGSSQILKDINKFKEQFYKHNPTILQATPSAWNMLLNLGWQGRSDLTLISGGEKLNQELGERLLMHCGKLFNLYGPTETTIWSTYKLVETGEDLRTIGKPIHNTRILILDALKQLVPVGTQGELYIAGEGLARGYLNNPELTSQKFITIPWLNSERYYSTGDIGKWTAEGEIEFLGRGDDQVKVRGFRIELGEIENAMLQIPAISKAAVLAKPDGKGSSMLVAYFESRYKVEIDEIIQYLKRSLPEYMIPGMIMYMNSIPATPNGKMDRKALSALDLENYKDIQTYNPPQNATEEALVRIWEHILNRENIGVNENFFRMGGHSIKAIQTVSLINQEFNIDLELKNIFLYPTIEELAGIILAAVQIESPALTPLPEQEYYEATHGQKGLFLKYYFSKEKAPFNMVRMANFEGLSPEIFEKAVFALIERHESLRTTLHLVNGEVKQKIHPLSSWKFSIEIDDLNNEDPTNQAHKVAHIIEQGGNTLFDLEQGPLLKINLLHLGQERFMVLLVIDHIISDGWSLEVLIEELRILYSTYNQENSLEPLTIQVKEYAAFQSDMLKSSAIVKHQSYWHNIVKDYKMLDLPADLVTALSPNNLSYRYTLSQEAKTYYRDMTDSERDSLNGMIFSARPLKGASYRVAIDKPVFDGINKLASDGNTSLFAALMSTISMLVYKITGKKDIIIGTPVSIRDREELNKLIGWFLDTLLVRIKFDEDASIEDLIGLASQSIAESMEHRIYPFEKILNDLDISTEVLGEVFMNLLNFGVNDRGELTNFLPAHRETGTPTFKINFTFYEYSNALELICDYRADLFSKEAIESIVNQYLELLNNIVTNHLSNQTDLQTQESTQVIFI